MRRPIRVFAPGGVCVPPSLPKDAVRSYRTFRLAWPKPGGFLSVALSLGCPTGRYPAPLLCGAGLSSA